MHTDTARHLPSDHVSSLLKIEGGYWWYSGRVYWAQQLISLWQKEFNAGGKIDYADLGCGTGGFAKEIAAQMTTKRAALIDGDPAVLKLASKHPEFEMHNLNLGGTFQLPFAPNLVTCMDVIEHLPDDAGFLKQVAAQMHRGGAVIVSVPAHPWLFSEWDRQLGHYRRYTPRTLRAALDAAGLHTVMIRYMWSFLMPAAPYRKFKANRYRQQMEFEKVPDWMNSLLVQFSRLEWEWAKRFPTLPGTSLIAMTVKK